MTANPGQTQRQVAGEENPAPPDPQDQSASSPSLVRSASAATPTSTPTPPVQVAMATASSVPPASVEPAAAAPAPSDPARTVQLNVTINNTNCNVARATSQVAQGRGATRQQTRNENPCPQPAAQVQPQAATPTVQFADTCTSVRLNVFAANIEDVRRRNGELAARLAAEHARVRDLPPGSFAGVRGNELTLVASVASGNETMEVQGIPNLRSFELVNGRAQIEVPPNRAFRYRVGRSFGHWDGWNYIPPLRCSGDAYRTGTVRGSPTN